MTKYQWTSASFVAVIAFAFASGSACADPLFSQMVGTWNGTGTRVYPISGRQAEVRETVVTTIQNMGGQPAAVSTDHVTEISSTGTPNSYTTTYWVKARAGQPGTYDLGAVPTAAPSPESATGVLGSDGIFRVDQNLGNGYLVHSETTFAPDETIYTEVFTSGTTVQSLTKVVFTRITRGVSRPIRSPQP